MNFVFSNVLVKKKPRSRSLGADNYSELEDGVEWYEEEKCSAEKCKRPKNKRVKWVITFIFLIEVFFCLLTLTLIMLTFAISTASVA